MTYLIDGGAMDTREAAHAELARTLSFPAYYGKNLDALHDCLTDMRTPAEITLVRARAMEAALGEYGGRIVRVLRDAAQENPALRVIIYP